MHGQNLNQRAAQLAAIPRGAAECLRIAVSVVEGVTLLDFGVEAEGGLAAGLLLARLCLSDLAEVRLAAAEDSRVPVPRVLVHTDHPLEACLMSQYAGWRIASDDFFAMASGPMRAVARKEPLFDTLPPALDHNTVVGILEAGRLPTTAALEQIRHAVGRARHLILAVARTASQAGQIQIVARSVETAIHKLHELHFPLSALVSGLGNAPLPPVPVDDLQGIGRSNDAILYGATVNLWVRCQDSLIETIGPQVPSSSSPAHGQKFLTLFEAAERDFYKLDPSLFSPAVVVFHNLSTGRTFRYGQLLPELVAESFGF